MFDEFDKDIITFIKNVSKYYGIDIKVDKTTIKSFVDSKQHITEFLKCIPPKFYNSKTKEEYFRNRCDAVNVPKEFINRWEQYLLLESQPQPEQKSKEWYEMRDKFITASAGADAINESKYNTYIDLLETKLGIGKPFTEGYHVHHGKKLENIATMLYEHINNVKVGEFGLVPHMSDPHVPFLSASPDGICTCMTLDGKFSPLVGRMLEIKCVTTRRINPSGPEHMIVTKKDEDLGIVPHVYWVQMQLQLECCDLEECDFWQCKIKNYWSPRTLIEARDNLVTSHTIGHMGKERLIDPNLECGTLIELIPIDDSIVPEGDKIEWYGKYIYPPKLDDTLEEKIEWANFMKQHWKTHYPQFATDYKFGKILYYHLEQSHCYLVKRDREWFKNTLPRFAEFWDKVIYYKNNPDKIYEIEELKKAYKDKTMKKMKPLPSVFCDED